VYFSDYGAPGRIDHPVPSAQADPAGCAAKAACRNSLARVVEPLSVRIRHHPSKGDDSELCTSRIMARPEGFEPPTTWFEANCAKLSKALIAITFSFFQISDSHAT